MDKVKNFFSPGHSADDELMYGTSPQRSSSGNKGKLAGEGSHFQGEDSTSPPQSAHPDQKVATEQSQAGSEPDFQETKGKVAGQGSHFDTSQTAEEPKTGTGSNAMESATPSDPVIAEPRSSGTTTGPRSTEPTSEATRASERAYNPTSKSTNKFSSSQAGTVNQQSTEPSSQSRSGGETSNARDAAGLGVAGGAATAAAGAAWKSGTTSGFDEPGTESQTNMPGSFPGDEANPYRTAHIDPRVDSKPSTPTKTSSNRETAPASAEKSHYGQDAGIGAAGVGAAGLGAYEATKAHNRQEGQTSATPSTETARKSETNTSKAAVGGNDFARQENAPQKATHAREDPSNKQEDHHYGRDAGVIGSVAGAVGLGSYVTGKDSDRDAKQQKPEAPGDSAVESNRIHQEASATRQPDMAGAGGLDNQRYDPSGTSKQRMTPVGTFNTTETPKHEPPKEQHHYGRDAGLATGAGVAGLGAYETKEHHEDSEPQKQPAQRQVRSDDNTKSQHRYDRDAGLATGAAGLGAYESEKYFDKPESRDKADPKEVLEEKPSKDQHHYGRDAGITAGVGAAGVGAYEAKQHYNDHETSKKAAQQESSSSPTAPPDHMTSAGHNRNTSRGTLDDATAALLARNAALEQAGSQSTTQPYPSTKTHPTNARAPEMATSEKDQHHYARDAGLAAGAGGVGLGAYEAKKHHDQPAGEALQRSQEQPAAGATQSEIPERTSSAKPSNYPQQTHHNEQAHGDNNTGRDAAVGAAGVGAGAYGTHELRKHHENGENWPLKDTPSQAQDTHSQPVPTSGARDEHAQREKDDHTARNAALGGAAVAGAGAYAGHEMSQNEAEKLEKKQLAEEKAHQKELAHEQAKHQKELDKSAAKEARQQEKELAKQEKHAEKEAAKAEKKHEKEIAAQEKEHEKLERQREKEARKAEKQHSKEVEGAAGGAAAGAATGGVLEHEDSSESQDQQRVDSPGRHSMDSEEKKKHGLRGLLHKIAHPGEKDEEHTADSSSDHHDRHRLHKEPYKHGHGQGYSGDEMTPAYADYAVQENQHPGAKTVTGGYTAPDVSQDPTKYPPEHTEENQGLLEKEEQFLSKRFGQ
ncbi:MAG: hypothetical protein Q9227_000225 [Pyrenula ochraceoflavens]